MFILISYLLDNAKENNWFVIVGDFSKELAKEAVRDSENGKAIFFDVKDDNQLN